MKVLILIFSLLASSFASAGETILLKDCKVSLVAVRYVEPNTLSGAMNCSGGVQGFESVDPDVKALIISAKTTGSSFHVEGATRKGDQRLQVRSIEVQQ